MKRFVAKSKEDGLIRYFLMMSSYLMFKQTALILLSSVCIHWSQMFITETISYWGKRTISHLPSKPKSFSRKFREMIENWEKTTEKIDNERKTWCYKFLLKLYKVEEWIQTIIINQLANNFIIPTFDIPHSKWATTTSQKRFTRKTIKEKTKHKNWTQSKTNSSMILLREIQPLKTCLTLSPPSCPHMFPNQYILEAVSSPAIVKFMPLAIMKL